jgi:hypothetical protein
MYGLLTGMSPGGHFWRFTFGSDFPENIHQKHAVRVRVGRIGLIRVSQG